MKKRIENHDELLKRHAVQGDPHAFFSLGATSFRIRYLRERHNGASHQDAATRILSDAIELLEGLQHVAPSHFEAWLEEHLSISSEENEEVLFDKKIAADTEAFLNRCSRELLRTGSEIKKAKLGRERRFPRSLLRSRLVIGLLATTGAFIIIAGVFATMVVLRTSVSIAFRSPGHEFSFQFPPEEVLRADSSGNTGKKTLSPADSGSTELVTSGSSGQDSLTTSPPQASAKEAAPVPVARKTLPPVIPRARLIVPPPVPPPPTPVASEPVPQEATVAGQTENSVFVPPQSPVAEPPALESADSPQ